MSRLVLPFTDEETRRNPEFSGCSHCPLWLHVQCSYDQGYDLWVVHPVMTGGGSLPAGRIWIVKNPTLQGFWAVAGGEEISGVKLLKI